MSQFQLNREFYDKPIQLTESEKANPLKVVEDFFSDYRLSDLRQIQEEIQEICLTTDLPPFSEPESRSDLILYNRKLIALLEAAALLRGLFAAPVMAPKAEGATTSPVSIRSNYTKAAELVKGINEVILEVAKLFLVLVKAWHAKVFADLRLPSNSKKGPRSAETPSIDLDKLQSMALTLQNKLADLSNMAIDILINEMNLHHPTAIL
jgi:hypothetical protein